jgi:GxxExxY protein
MPNANHQYSLQQETGAIIGLAMEVHNTLGAGFLEAVYVEALEYEFIQHGITFGKQKCYQIEYKDIVLQKKYYADLVAFDSVIIEIKAKSEFTKADMAQTINYLKCSGNKVALILNFGADKRGVKRVFF